MKVVDVTFKQMPIHFIRLFYSERRLLICDNNIYSVHTCHKNNSTGNKTVSTHIALLHHTALRSGSTLQSPNLFHNLFM